MGVPEDLPGAHQGHAEVVLGAGVPRHEHVVRDAAQLHLLAPHLCPHLSAVVDVSHQGRLGPDLGACLPDARDGRLHGVGAELSWMVEVGHDRQV